MAHGLGHGPVGAAVAAWPAVALVGCYELLMMVIRSSQAVTDGLPGSANIPDQFGEQAAEIFAGLLAADHVPSIRAQLQSASPEPNGCRTTSPQGLQGEPKVPPHEQQEKEQFALLVNETRNAPDDEPDPG